MQPRRFFCLYWTPLVFLLSGCLTTLSAPGPSVPLTPLHPSLAVAAPGSHWQAAVTASEVDVGDWSSAHGYAQALSGGWLWQPGLVSDTSLGWFASAQGRLAFSELHLDSDAADGTLTSQQISTLTANPTDFETSFDLRAGVTGKLYAGTASAYVHLLGQYETGSYFDYRHSTDGIGRYYNAADSPWTGGIGWGADLSVGSADQWSAGATLELSVLGNRTQSYVDTQDSSGEDMDIVRAGGTQYSFVAATLTWHLEIQQIQLLYSLTAVNSNTGLTQGASVGYRW